MASEINPNQGNAGGAVSSGAQAGASAGPIGSIIGGMVGGIANRVQEERNKRYREQALAEQRQAEARAFSTASHDIMRTGVDPRVAGSQPQQVGTAAVAPSQSSLAGSVVGGMDVGASVGNSAANTAIKQAEFEENQRQFEWNQTNKVFDSMRSTLTDSLANAHDGKKFYVEQIQNALIRAGINVSHVKGKTDNYTHTYRKERQDIIDKIAREKYGFGVKLSINAEKGSTKGVDSRNASKSSNSAEKGKTKDNNKTNTTSKNDRIRNYDGTHDTNYGHRDHNWGSSKGKDFDGTGQHIEDGDTDIYRYSPDFKYKAKSGEYNDWHDKSGRDALTISDVEVINDEGSSISESKRKIDSVLDKVSQGSDFARGAFKSVKAAIGGDLSGHFDYEKLSEEDKREVDAHMSEWSNGWVKNNVDTEVRLDDTTRLSLLSYLDEYGRQYQSYTDDEEYYKSARDYLYYDMRDFNDAISRYRSKRPHHRTVDAISN